MITDCANCQAEDVECILTQVPGLKSSEEMCEVCRNTFCSHALIYPQVGIILKALAGCTNLIIKAIKDSRSN